ncbi:MAG TPA: hypothetical protein VGB67_00210 [Fibrella sp.]|jgi:hypothetical protein
MKKGQTVYLVSNDGRTNAVLTPMPYEVVSIGTKWITVEKGWHKARFDKVTLRHDAGRFTPRFTLYLSLQEHADQQETRRLRDKLSKYLYDSKPLSLPTLRHIWQLIDMENLQKELNAKSDEDNTPIR